MANANATQLTVEASNFFTLPAIIRNLLSAASDDAAQNARGMIDANGIGDLQKGLSTLTYALSEMEELPADMRANAERVLAEFQYLAADLAIMAR